MTFFPGTSSVKDGLKYVGHLALDVAEVGIALWLFKLIWGYVAGYDPDVIDYIFFLFIILVVDLRIFARKFFDLVKVSE